MGDCGWVVIVLIWLESKGGAIQMNFPQAIASGFAKYVTFSGRASRSEYWYWVLFLFLGHIVFEILDAAIFHNANLGPLNALFSLATIIPSLAIEIRRLHDVDRTGWWILISLTIIGLIYPLLVWKCTKGTDGANRFGPDPLGIDAQAVEVFS
jgi:uncharacterized membrane protein YhaH (DUF805 family)